jgi:hypothetical protein
MLRAMVTRRPSPRIVVLSLAAIALLVGAIVVPALAAPKVQRGLLLRGTPIGENTLENHIGADFFLNERVLGSQVHATIDHHAAKVKHVGGNSAFYAADLPPFMKLNYGRSYRIVIRACDKTGCSTYHQLAKLPKPGL